MFDLNNRNSFDNLNDYWLTFIRDDCAFSGDIYILGNYTEDSNSVLTQKEEINDMIDKSGISAKYIEYGNKSKEEIVKMLDDLVIYLQDKEEKSSKTDKNKAESFKNCAIF
jgi:hypothetical protein